MQSTGGKRNHAEENRRRDDWQETVAHAEELAQELEDALKRLRHIERWYQYRCAVARELCKRQFRLHCVFEGCNAATTYVVIVH